MNFRLTKVKVIWSIVIAVIIWVLINLTPMESPPGKHIPLIDPLANILALIVLILFYLIWSFIQKKK
jgi:hypothetical protein